MLSRSRVTENGRWWCTGDSKYLLRLSCHKAPPVRPLQPEPFITSSHDTQLRRKKKKKKREAKIIIINPRNVKIISATWPDVTLTDPAFVMTNSLEEVHNGGIVSFWSEEEWNKRSIEVLASVIFWFFFFLWGGRSKRTKPCRWVTTVTEFEN